MSRMIPPNIGTHTKSIGEKRLFEKFKREPDTEDWIVCHSIGVAKHRTRLSGEIDLIVMIPGQGILCIEVKDSKTVKRTEGNWLFSMGESGMEGKLSPFVQVSESMHSLKDYIYKQDWSLRSLLVWSCVFFTRNAFNEKSEEWDDWQFVNETMLKRRTIRQICLNILRQAHQKTKSSPSCSWYHETESRPTTDQCNKLLEILRGDFEFISPPSAFIEENDIEIDNYTAEQYKFLDLMEENDRLIIKGPAGTGKTYMAIEAARRYSNKFNVLLICFNRNLAQWLSSVFEDKAEFSNLTYSSWHKFLEMHAGAFLKETEKDTNYFKQLLPEKFYELFFEEKINIEPYDLLIIDEVQDLVSETYLDIFDILVKGGLSGGKWLFLGDPQYQVIYDNAVKFDQNMENMIRARSESFVPFTLRTNCRNEITIAKGVENVSCMSPKYSDYLNRSGESHIETIIYSSNTDQYQKLEKILSDFISLYGEENIVLLSIKSDSKSIANRLKSSVYKPEKYSMSKSGDKVLRYSSVQAFKGLESPVIILTDIDSIKTDYDKSILYVGMSRAKYHLVNFVHEGSVNDWQMLFFPELNKNINTKGSDDVG